MWENQKYIPTVQSLLDYGFKYEPTPDGKVIYERKCDFGKIIYSTRDQSFKLIAWKAINTASLNVQSIEDIRTLIRFFSCK